MSNKKDITKELGTGKILPLVLRLSFPAIIAQLITFLYNLVDRMYVAKIASHGMDALAALGIVLPIILILEAFSSLIAFLLCASIRSRCRCPYRGSMPVLLRVLSRRP